MLVQWIRSRRCWQRKMYVLLFSCVFLVFIDIADDVQLKLCHRCSLESRVYREFPRSNQLLLGRRRLNVTQSDLRTLIKDLEETS